MSKNYNLRNRAAASASVRAPLSSPEPERRLYSDVAASRPSSPSGDGENPAVTAGIAGFKFAGTGSSAVPARLGPKAPALAWLEGAQALWNVKPGLSPQ